MKNILFGLLALIAFQACAPTNTKNLTPEERERREEKAYLRMLKALRR